MNLVLKHLAFAPARVAVGSNRIAVAAAGLALCALVGCSSTAHRAPVEERPTRGGTNAGFTTVTPAGTAPATEGARVPPGSENAGKPGYYTVKPSDTLIRIGLETGQNWKDIAKWNSLENSNAIEVGQVLRVAAPGTDANGVTTRGVVAPGADTRPVTVPAAAGKPATTTPPATAPTVVATAPATVPPAPPTTSSRDDDDVNWLWPASGQVIAGFDEQRSKGLSIAGKAGDPVLAAADGKVVYAGSGLRGYGNLVIVKHNSVYLTAYAHNQTLLVKEEQTVKRGQKIAEMGATDADRVQLHFEIRKQGKPIDPAKLLPAR
jgi:lipoprotein NlpD